MRHRLGEARRRRASVHKSLPDGRWSTTPRDKCRRRTEGRARAGRRRFPSRPRRRDTPVPASPDRNASRRRDRARFRRRHRGTARPDDRGPQRRRRGGSIRRRCPGIRECGAVIVRPGEGLGRRRHSPRCAPSQVQLLRLSSQAATRSVLVERERLEALAFAVRRSSAAVAQAAVARAAVHDIGIERAGPRGRPGRRRIGRASGPQSIGAAPHRTDRSRTSGRDRPSASRPLGRRP